MGASQWKVGLGLQLVLLILSITTMVLSARVNMFQEWFFAADIITFTFSLLSSLLVLALAIPILLSSLNHSHSPFAYFLTTRLHIHRRMSAASARVLQLGIYSILAVVWIASAAFGTSRWKAVPMSCPSVEEILEDDAETTSDDANNIISWCANLKGLRVMVWVLCAGFLLAAIITFRTSSYSRQDTNSEFLQFEYPTENKPGAVTASARQNYLFGAGIGSSSLGGANPFASGGAATDSVYSSNNAGFGAGAGYGATGASNRIASDYPSTPNYPAVSDYPVASASHMYMGAPQSKGYEMSQNGLREKKAVQIGSGTLYM